MNSCERKAARKIRRIQKREEKKSQRSYNDINNVITYEHLIEAFEKCRKNVSWKTSVQEYSSKCIYEIATIVRDVRHGIKPKLKNPKKIYITERGKTREITPIVIYDRVLQRCICDYALIPALTPSLIYDNGASLKGKGVKFSRDRIKLHMEEAVKEYGKDFYILVFDFKSFFDSIPHQVCKDILKEHIHNDAFVSLIMDIVKSYALSEIKQEKDESVRNALMTQLNNDELKGLCLGSQISQILAVSIPNKLDHYIKDICGVKHYIRYMDDGVIISDSKEYLQELYTKMIKICDELGLKFNAKKTMIVKSTKGFTFLKVKYRVLDDGTILRSLTRKGVTRMRRKLKKLHKMFECGEIDIVDIYNSIQSWISHTRGTKSKSTIKNILNLYETLFEGYKLIKRWKADLCHIKLIPQRNYTQTGRLKYI